MLLSARVCLQASMRAFVCACVRACFCCAHEIVFQSVFENVLVCFSLPVLVTAFVFVLCLCVSAILLVNKEFCVCECVSVCLFAFWFISL